MEEGDKLVWVYFDKNDGIEDLDIFIWDFIKVVLVEKNIFVEKVDKVINSIEIGWYIIIKFEDGWFWESEKEVF